MRLAKQCLAALALVPCAFLFISCEKVHATVTCLNPDKFHSDLGTVNIPLYSLGQVLQLLDDGSGKKRVFSAGVLNVTDQDKSTGDAADSLEIKLAASFKVSFDVQVPQAVQAQAESSISRNTSVTLTKIRRISINQPLTLLNAADTTLKDTIKSATGSSTRRFVIVTSIKPADSLDIHLSDDAEGKIGTNIVKYADVEVALSYKCDGMVSLKGRQTGVFYGVTPVTYDAQGKLALDTRPVDMWEYDHSNAFTHQ